VLTERVPRVFRSALFVDFDNVYSNLLLVDQVAADLFATTPDRLLAWLTVGEDEEGSFRRRFLTRTCYLNPGPFGKFRSFFASTGFRVVDCPSLTKQGKSSADIHLVLDAVDALARETRYDEFVVCSADADFTPLMARVRAHDRRTTMVAAGPTSNAYRAVCDDSFDAMQLIAALRPPSVPSVASTGGRSAETFTEAEGETARGAQPPSGDVEVAPAVRDTTEDEAARAAVRAALAAAEDPVRLAAVANAARNAVPTIKARWDQEGGFTAWLQRRLPDLLVVPSPAGGPVLLDPARHESPVGAQDLPARVCRVTRVPALTSDQYATVFEELSGYLAGNQFELTATSRAVRDRCVARDAHVSRAAISFILQGLVYAGTDLRGAAWSAEELGRAWSGNVVALAENARMELDDDDRAELDSWILGALVASE
jgi:hypothetical protein